MGKIFYLMGKSASGKDTLFRLLMERFSYLKTVVMYSTRPIRDHVVEGREYFFVTRDYRREMEAKGKENHFGHRLLSSRRILPDLYAKK